MTGKTLGLISGVLGILLLLIPDEIGVIPDNTDIVSKAFDTYERLWRQHQNNTLSKVLSKELDTQQKVWDYIAAGQEPARRMAFDEIAKKEQEFFKDGWTAEKQAELLRGYAK